MMAIFPLASTRHAANGRTPTELERYVRIEFGERNASWLIAQVAPQTAEPVRPKAHNGGHLLRRVARAIATFF